MNENILSNINSDTFNYYINTFSDEEIIKIWDNTDKIEKNTNIDLVRFNNLIYKLNDNTLNKLLKNISLNKLIFLYKNSQIYLLDKFHFWDNKHCFIDFINIITLLSQNNMLDLIQILSDVKFKLHISKLKYYQIKLIYPYIRDQKCKFQILLNTIDDQFLINLINFFTEKDIEFLNLNYNFLFRFNQISIFAVSSFEQIQLMNVTKLQIILLLQTTNEIKIKNKILEQDIDFIKLIINSLNITTFLYIIKNIQMNSLYQLIDIIKIDYIISLLPCINNDILQIFIIKLDLYKLYKLINKLSLSQFILSLYYITDDKLEALNNMNNIQKNYITNLFNTINENLYDEYLPYLTKQIIVCILNTSFKDTILQNADKFKLNNIKLIINFLNYDDIIIILNKFNVENRITLINYLHEEKYSMMSNYIDSKLNTSDISELNPNDKINFCIFFNFLNLNLSSKSYKKIKQILEI